MQRRHFTRHFSLPLGAAALLPAGALRAESWPDKAVKWVLSQPPGSGPDNVARLLAERLQKLWGQTDRQQAGRAKHHRCAGGGT